MNIEGVIRPLGGKIVVEKISYDRKTSSGLHIPNIANTNNIYAKVLAMGDGTLSPLTGTRQEMPVKPGDVVLIPNTCGAPLELGATVYTMLDVEDVQAIVEDPEAIRSLLEGDSGGQAVSA